MPEFFKNPTPEMPIIPKFWTPLIESAQSIFSR
jgi:hypothetical protein